MADRNSDSGRRSSRAPWEWITILSLFVISVLRPSTPSLPQQTREPATAGTRAVKRERSDTAFEPSDWNLAPVALIFAATLALLILCCFVLIAAYPTALPDVSRSVRVAPPIPQLLTNPSSELKRVRAKEERQLNTYYWINKAMGTVHIPIEQAMRKLAKTGIPGFGEGQHQ